MSQHTLSQDFASTSSIEKFLPAKAVWERYGIVPITLSRWLKDPDVEFPQPICIRGNRRFWRLSDLEAWELARVAVR